MIAKDMSVCMQFIPMPVLYGVFLYMGVTSLGGVQVRQLYTYQFMHYYISLRKPVFTARQHSLLC